MPLRSDETTQQGANESDSQYEDFDEEEAKDKAAENIENDELPKEEAKEGEANEVPKKNDESSTMPLRSDETTQQGANESDSQNEDIDEEEAKDKAAEKIENDELPKEEAKEGEANEVPKNPTVIPKKGRFYEHDIRGGNKDDEGDNEHDSDKNAQRKPKKIDGMWTHDKFDAEAQKPGNATRRGTGNARKNFNSTGARLHDNKSDARRRPLVNKKGELEISDYVRDNETDKLQKVGQRKEVEAHGDRRTSQNQSNSESQSEARDEKKTFNDNRDHVDRKPQNRTENQRGPKPFFDRNQTLNHENRYNEDVNNNRRPKNYNNHYRANQQDSHLSSDNTEKQINMDRSLNFSNTRYRKNNEQNSDRGSARHEHDDRTQPHQYQPHQYQQTNQSQEVDEKPKRYSSMRNQRPLNLEKQQMDDNQKSYQQAHKMYAGDNDAHQHFDNQNWKANGAAQQARQGRPIVGAGMNTSANVYSPTSAAAVAVAAANLQLQYNQPAIPLQMLQAQQIMSPPPGISMPHLMQQQQQQQQFYNFVPYPYQN